MAITVNGLRRIDELETATAVADDDLLLVKPNGGIVTKSVKLSTLKEAVGSSDSGGTTPGSGMTDEERATLAEVPSLKTDVEALQTAHDTYFGSTLHRTYVNADATLANNTGKAVASLTLEPGLYIIIASVLFSASSSGTCQVSIRPNAGEVGAYRGTSASVAASSGYRPVVQAVTVMPVNTTTTYYCNALQTSGSNMSVQGQLMATQLSALPFEPLKG